MDSAMFAVNDEPYCIWDSDVLASNKDFLTGLDPASYFDYLLNLHADAEDEKRAALSLRAALHHALETLFTLIAGYVQAPGCLYAWVPKCQNSALRDILTRIERKDGTLLRLRGSPDVGWEPIAASIFNNAGWAPERTKRTAERFAQFWARMASEFISSDHIDEYNAIKHGLRIRNAGFSLSIGTEHKFGVAPPPSEMKPLGGSKFGSAFYHVRPASDQKGNRSLVSERISLNWSIERVMQQLQLVGCSITNVLSALRIANGFPASECRFERPSEDEAFQNPWSHSVGITRFSTGAVLGAAPPYLTRDQLLEKLRTEK